MQAKSGTGKTCVFSTIALDALMLESPATQVSAGPCCEVVRLGLRGGIGCFCWENNVLGSGTRASADVVRCNCVVYPCT